MVQCMLVSTSWIIKPSLPAHNVESALNQRWLRVDSTLYVNISENKLLIQPARSVQVSVLKMAACDKYKNLNKYHRHLTYLPGKLVDNIFVLFYTLTVQKRLAC